MITSVSIEGFRGFARRQEFNLAIPNGSRPGSGLTLLVGPNNSGKSTVIEAIQAVTQVSPPSFHQGMRNSVARGVKIGVVTDSPEDSSKERTLQTVRDGGAETEWVPSAPAFGRRHRPLVLTSRRWFDPLFGKGEMRREGFAGRDRLGQPRGTQEHEFTSILSQVNKDASLRDRFNRKLADVLKAVPKWTLDQYASRQFYIAVTGHTGTHDTGGTGEGLVSLLFIVGALYDADEGDLIVIDEPELSLHPEIQVRLRDLLIRESANKQIVIATHSVHFISWDAIFNGARVVRLVSEPGTGVRASALSNTTADRLRGLVRGLSQERLLGLDASMVFFQDEPVVLTEGPNDVWCYRRIVRDEQVRLDGSFFGWGVGGADNMERIAEVLRELGFVKVAGILDSNKGTRRAKLASQFNGYRFVTSPADDVSQLLGSDGNLKPEHRDAVLRMFAELEAYFSSDGSPQTPVRKPEAGS